MTKRKRRIALVLVYMLLVIGGVNLTDFAQSHAYFTTNNKDNPLKYQANVVNAYQKTEIFLDPNKIKTKTRAPFVFTFDINQGVNTNTKDVYTVTTPTGCSVTRMSGSAITSKTNNITLPALDNGSNTEYRTGKITVEMACDLVIGQDRDIKASVKETVKDKTFKYADTETYNLVYSEYSKDISIEVTDTYGPVIESDTGILEFEEFKIWIKNYAQQTYTDYDFNNELMSNHVIDYAINANQGIFKTYKDFKVALDNAKATGKDTTTIPGISISYDASKKTFTYKTEANLLGYARTYRSYLGLSEYANLIFYFDTKNETEINNAFDYYLSHYIFKDSDVNIEDVKKYINSQATRGIVGVVLDKETVLGIYNANDGYEFDKESILKYMVATYPVSIPIDTESNMKFYINDIFSLVQFKDTEAAKIIKDVLNNSGTEENKNFYANLIHGASETPSDTVEYFTRYVDAVGEEDGYYMLFTVWSDRKTSNKLMFNKLTLPAGYKVYKWGMVAESDGSYPRLEIILESDNSLSSVDWTLSDSIVRGLGLDPNALAYGSITDGKEYSAAVSGHYMYIDIAEAPLLNYLNSIVPKSLTEYTTRTAKALRAKASKPTINTEPVIPPLELDTDTSDTDDNKDESDVKVTEENVTSCTEDNSLVTETKVEGDTTPEESSAEPTEDKSKIVQKEEDLKSYPSDNVSDNPNKNEESEESSSLEQMPKIK